MESYVLPKIKTFLAERGLSLNPDKKTIVNLNEGFDFLGFNVRRYPNFSPNRRRWSNTSVV